MSFKLIPERKDSAGNARYGLWSTWVDGFVLEDATQEELREWADEAPQEADVPDVDELVATAQRQTTRAGTHRYEDASEFLADE